MRGADHSTQGTVRTALTTRRAQITSARGRKAMMTMEGRDPQLDPQPAWKQRRDRLVAWWRRSRNARQAALRNLRKAGAQALTLAISVVGAMLISYGVWRMYAPAGFIAGGFLCWLSLWSHEKDRERGRR